MKVLIDYEIMYSLICCHDLMYIHIEKRNCMFIII